MGKPSSFPVEVSAHQQGLLLRYAEMLVDINKRFYLISRGDVDHVVDRHIAHCLILATRSMPTGARIVDWGSGGGLPAIPLAIMWPKHSIVAVDSNGNKTRSIDLFCRKLGISNCSTWHGRAEHAEGSFTHSVSRATAPLKTLWEWHDRIADSETHSKGSSALWPSGLICLKGGELNAEIDELLSTFPNVQVDIQRLSELKGDAYFATKRCVIVTKDTHVSETS